jgi:hypothetical protein
VLFPIERAIDSPWPALIAGGLAGSAVYLGLLWVVARDALLRLRDMALAGDAGSQDEEPAAVADPMA